MFRHLLSKARCLRVALLMVLAVASLLFTSGSPAFAIYRGSPAAISSYPYMVCISYQTYDGTHSCDGTLIGPRWIATAAHCVVNGKTGAKLAPGAFRVAVGFDQPNWNKHWMTVNRVEYHPNFPAHLKNTQTWPADIGLLQISQSVSNPTLPLVSSEPAVASVVTFVGWGCTNSDPKVECGAPATSLMVAGSTVKSDQECAFAGSGQAYVAFDICTSRPGPSSTVRHGDSGGPMIGQTSLGARLAGVISGSDGAKDYSTSVAYVLPWIHQVTGIGAPAESTSVPPANNPPPPAPGAPAGASTYLAHVLGTCNEGHCGLNVRAAPGYTNVAAVGSLSDGTAYTIVCQARGENVTGRNGSSTAWNGFIYGGVLRYVSDYYSDTPGINQMLPGIRGC